MQLKKKVTQTLTSLLAAATITGCSISLTPNENHQALEELVGEELPVSTTTRSFSEYYLDSLKGLDGGSYYQVNHGGIIINHKPLTPELYEKTKQEYAGQEEPELKALLTILFTDKEKGVEETLRPTKTKPYNAVAAIGVSDWNNALKNTRKMEFIYELKDNFNTDLVFVSHQDDILSRTYPEKINLWSIGGHSTRNLMELGTKNGDEYELTQKDYPDVVRFIERNLAKNAIIVLYGCSSGGGTQKKESHEVKNLSNMFLAASEEALGADHGITVYGATTSFTQGILASLLETPKGELPFEIIFYSRNHNEQVTYKASPEALKLYR